MSFIQILVRYGVPAIAIATPLFFMSRSAQFDKRQRTIATWLVAIAIVAFIGSFALDALVSSGEQQVVDTILTRVANLIQPVVTIAVVWILFRRVQQQEQKPV